MNDELGAFEVSLLDAYREASSPTPSREDALLAQILAEVEAEEPQKFQRPGKDTRRSEDDEPGKARTDPRVGATARPWSMTALAAVAFAAGLLLAWGVRGTVLSPVRHDAPSSAPMHREPEPGRELQPTMQRCTPEPEAVLGRAGPAELPEEGELEGFDPGSAEFASRDRGGDSDAQDPAMAVAMPPGPSRPNRESPEASGSELGRAQVIAFVPTSSASNQGVQRGQGGWTRAGGGGGAGGDDGRSDGGSIDRESGKAKGKPGSKPRPGSGRGSSRPSGDPRPDRSPVPSGDEPGKPEGPPEEPWPPEEFPEEEPEEGPAPESEEACYEELEGCHHEAAAICEQDPMGPSCDEFLMDCQYRFDLCLGADPYADECGREVDRCYMEAEMACEAEQLDPQACDDYIAQCQAQEQACWGEAPHGG